jgi:hypothetical protein
MSNPLQNYFRQPKIYLKLPSLGKYNDPSSITGNIENMPIYGMTGMDQIIIKTPDALLNGESTVKIIQSCCPNILNAWDITNLDINSLLVAIRIATFGNVMNIMTTCNHCNTESNYDADISQFLQHFSSGKFDPNVVVDDLVVKLKPLSYKQATALGLENFTLQKQLFQSQDIEDDKQRQEIVSRIYEEFAVLQNKSLVASIDYVETPSSVVSEYGYIKEWIDNCDDSGIKKIKEKLDSNSMLWKAPSLSVKCVECGAVNEVEIEMDNASFFANA